MDTRKWWQSRTIQALGVVILTQLLLGAQSWAASGTWDWRTIVSGAVAGILGILRAAAPDIVTGIKLLDSRNDAPPKG